MLHLLMLMVLPQSAAPVAVADDAVAVAEVANVATVAEAAAACATVTDHALVEDAAAISRVSSYITGSWRCCTF